MERTRRSKLRLYGFEIIDSKIFDSQIRGLEKERSERGSLAASSGLVSTWQGVHGNIPRMFNPHCFEDEIFCRRSDLLAKINPETRTRECHDVLS